MRLSQAQIARLWEGMFLAEMRALYFGDLATRYNSRLRYSTWATLFMSSTAVVTVVAKLRVDAVYWWVPIVLTIATALLSGYSVAMQNQKLSVEASGLHHGWSRLASQYRAIWENVGAADALARLDKADETADDLSKIALQLPNRQDLIEKWQDRVEAQWVVRTAPLAHAV